MDRLTPNTLFHFTKSSENLIGILKDGFYPRYSLELWINYAFPMVCFCDISLSQIKKHMETYGRYGIGMSKEWAKKQGLNPVLYFSETSTFTKNIQALMRYAVKVTPEKVSATEKDTLLAVYELGKLPVELIRYMKPYEGKLYRDTGIIPNIRFYDEREWRYVPSVEKCEECGAYPFLSETDFKNLGKREQENAKIEKAKLSFEVTDIKYIIVEKEKERLPVAKTLEFIKGSKYTHDDVEILKTKIITSEQIEEDF